MPYGEFPHTNYEDTDFRELIELYIKVDEEYSNTLKEIESVSKRLNEYQSSMNAVIKQQVDLAVEPAINNYSSTIESQLRDINNSINNLNNKVNSYNDTLSEAIEKLSKSLIDEAGNRQAGDTALDVRITNLNKRVTSIESNVTNKLAEQTIHLENELDALNEELNATLEKGLTSVTSTSIAYTIKQITALDNKLSAQIQDIAESSGSNAITWLWQYGCYHGGFSALEWYYLTEITAKEWNITDVNCNSWYVDGRKVFRKFDNRNKIYSPVSGRWIDVKTALIELAGALNVNSITAGAYDSLALTADNYDKMFITGVKYDWFGKEI